MTDGNYDAAVEMLQNRFGRKDIVVSAHMSKLLNLTPVKKSADIVALRQLYDECEIQIRSLESLGVYSDTYGCLLCPVLLQLIPEDIALAYTRKTDSSGEWDVLDRVRFLLNEVQSRERALQLSRPGDKPTQRDILPSNRPFTEPASSSENRPKRWTVPSAATLHVVFLRHMYIVTVLAIHLLSRQLGGCTQGQTEKDGKMLRVPRPKTHSLILQS